MFDVIGGMRDLRHQAARRLPAMRRSRRPNPAMLTAPIAAVAGVAAVAGLLLWDERRRAAMRRRMEEVVSSVGASVTSSLNRKPESASASSSLNRKPESVPTGTGQD
jgi:hypothetical protein